MKKYNLVWVITFIALIVATGANAGLLDKLKKKIDDEMKKAIDSGELKSPQPKETTAPQQPLEAPAQSSKSKSANNIGWLNPQHTDLLRLAIQINPGIIDYVYAYDYSLYFMNFGSQECQDASWENPRGSSRDEFTRKKNKEKYQKRANQLISEAKNADAVSRIFIYKTDDMLRSYDFKKKVFDFNFRMTNRPAVWLYDNRNQPRSCRISKTLPNSAFRHTLSLDRESISTVIPMDESKAEQYINKHNRAVKVELTLEVKNAVRKASLSASANSISFNVIIKRVKVLSPDNNTVLANLDVDDMNKFDAQKAELAQPDYSLDTSWARDKKSLDVRNQAIQGIRLGMTFTEAKKILEPKGYRTTTAGSAKTAKGVYFEKNDSSGYRKIIASWGNARFNPQNQRIYYIDYTRTYSSEVKFDTETIKQQIRQQFGEPDRESVYWSWPTTTESELQTMIAPCNESLKRFFKKLVTSRKNGHLGMGNNSAESLYPQCPKASAEDTNKMLEYILVPKLTAQVIGRNRSIKINTKWDYLLESQMTQNVVKDFIKKTERPSATFDP